MLLKAVSLLFITGTLIHFIHFVCHEFVRPEKLFVVATEKRYQNNCQIDKQEFVAFTRHRFTH